ncbi:hypothetical protein FK949_gp037 [Paramecium bursaria Chlorella virus NYs1]|uniref:Uncharacterized protein n=1 Tax=Paramecium bursaria Chlorella virus NYs1 TaxID=83442 RepID=M1I304_9PHYC|nr:hypothetical protein FK949_gp037 [Paramecium bursaria Chlorella virus NYs1]AGE58602.1 hypothetical protein PBCVNYs1_100L [Paramecium bursaria Chlorella virus NYs1]
MKDMPQEKPILVDDAIKRYVDSILTPEKFVLKSETDSSSEEDFPEWFAPFAKRISKLEIDDEQDSSIQQNLKLLSNYMDKIDELREKDDMIRSHENEIDDQRNTINSLTEKIDDQQYEIKCLKREIERRDKIVSDVYNKLSKFYGIIKPLDRSTLSACSVASSVGSN